MTQTAHVVDGLVREILSAPADHELPDVYPEAMLAACVEAGDDVRPGWTYDGKAFVAPAPVKDGGSGVREATGYALVMALTDDQRALYSSVKPWDQRRLSLRGSDHIPEDNPLVARVAAVLKTDPKAWFDAALGVGAT